MGVELGVSFVLEVRMSFYVAASRRFFDSCRGDHPVFQRNPDWSKNSPRTKYSCGFSAALCPYNVRCNPREVGGTIGGYPIKPLGLFSGLSPMLRYEQLNPAISLSSWLTRKEAGNSFETIAKLWHSKVSVEMVPNYAEKVIRSLEKDVFPSLGKRPINDIRPLKCSPCAMLRKIESRGALETLKRVRQRCADVFTFAIASGLSRHFTHPVARSGNSPHPGPPPSSPSRRRKIRPLPRAYRHAPLRCLECK